MKFTDGAQHYQTYRQVCINTLFAGRGLYEVSPCHHRNKTGPGYVRETDKITRAENCLQMRIACCLTKKVNLVIKPLPVASQHKASPDHDIDFLGTRFAGPFYLGNTRLQRRQSIWKTCSNRSDGDTRTLKGLDRLTDQGGIDANSAYCEVFDLKRPCNIRAQR